MHEPVRIRHFLLLLLLSGLFLAVGGVLGQEVDLSPSEIPGEAIYIPFPVEINLDGDLADWNGIPIIEVTQGSMLSSIPGENDRFTFAVAADLDNIYITMTMADKNIITNQHGTETWNEDSLEFFLNLTDDINLGTYQTGIFQIRIIPADIGNDDPNSLTIDGVFSTGVPVTGYVFETEDGWGFEAAVSIADYITPEHGKEIGFQAQANGATESSRDVKLIWSNADTTDNSWQDPSLFGTGIFFEVGQSEVPLPSDRDRPEPEAEPEELPPVISVNQVGYFPD
ncbi:MAG: sugar-binding protein, partial [Candidatus Promineifilaceae bacterium]